MSDKFSKQASLLTYLGILPFLMCAIANVVGFEQEKATFIMCAYGAVIVSFISGIHWGIAMKDSQRKTFWLLVTSNSIALLAWCSLLMTVVIGSLATLAICLILLIFIDGKLYNLGQTDLWFIKLRLRVTLLVVITFIASGLALL